MNLIKIYLKKIKIEKNYHTKKNPRFDVNYKERDQFLIRLVELELSFKLHVQISTFVTLK